MHPRVRLPTGRHAEDTKTDLCTLEGLEGSCRCFSIPTANSSLLNQSLPGSCSKSCSPSAPRHVSICLLFTRRCDLLMQYQREGFGGYSSSFCHPFYGAQLVAEWGQLCPSSPSPCSLSSGCLGVLVLGAHSKALPALTDCVSTPQVPWSPVFL